MKAVDRIIFIIVGLFLTAIAVASALLAVDVISMADIIGVLDFEVDLLVSVLLIVCAIIFFIVALRLIFVRPKKTKVPAYTIHKSDDGEISVSITAIENTVKLAMANFDDIKDVKTHISMNADGITISARVYVPTGVVIPKLLNDVKSFTKEFTQTHTGVVVNQIKLVATEYKNVDTASERKKMAAVKKQEEKKNNLREAQKPADAYAETHARIVLSSTAADAEIPTENETVEEKTEPAFEVASPEETQNVAEQTNVDMAVEE